LHAERHRQGAAGSRRAFSRQQRARDEGLSEEQAAAIVGNLDQESNVNPRSVQLDGGPGRGIAQWSVGARWNVSRNDNVAWFAAREGASSSALDLQLAFIWC